MVSAGRVACIFTPFALTLAALICLVLVFLAGTMEKNKTVDDLYFAKIDLTNLTLTSSANLLGTDASTNLTVLNGALEAAKQSLGMYDYYTIYLRNYCAWNGDDKYAFCSPTESKFYFDPLKVWGLNATSTGTAIEEALPKSFRDGLKTYQKVSGYMFYLFVAALAATALTIVVGISAIFSRWGSFATTFFASISGVLLLAATIIATALFITVKTALNESLKKDYGIDTKFGSQAYVVSWLGVAFALAAGFFWLLSVCCCSGRSPYNPGSKDARRTRAEKTPYTYERVGSPHLGPQGGQAVPLNNLNSQGHAGYSSGPSGSKQTAYEPFRPQQI